MREIETASGRVRTGPLPELFAEAAALGRRAWDTASAGAFSWALTGGSTPKAWYRWCLEQSVLPPELVRSAHWFVSDERCVPPTHDESNFGNAERLLLEPLEVPAAHRHPWRVESATAAGDLSAELEQLAGGRGFSLCFLGLGDDGHTASLFPGSPLLAEGDGALFAAVEVPGRGRRLTITPAGLRECGRIAVIATGPGKAAAVQRVFADSGSIGVTPARLLATVAERVTWLLDDAAAALL